MRRECVCSYPGNGLQLGNSVKRLDDSSHSLMDTHASSVSGPKVNVGAAVGRYAIVDQDLFSAAGRDGRALWVRAVPAAAVAGQVLCQTLLSHFSFPYAFSLSIPVFFTSRPFPTNAWRITYKVACPYGPIVGVAALARVLLLLMSRGPGRRAFHANRFSRAQCWWRGPQRLCGAIDPHAPYGHGQAQSATADTLRVKFAALPRHPWPPPPAAPFLACVSAHSIPPPTPPPLTPRPARQQA